ncbi:SDR family oxidoreductase [Myxococcota bacterium]|nr:SDR family oxidoreductase [Myxococcota bacterium]
MGLLEGRVVLVSGFGPGLGRSVGKAVLLQGGSIVVGDLDGARAEAIRHELDPDAKRSVASTLDITSGASCDALVEQARRRFGRLDGVVHVAALDHVVGGLLEGGLDDWDRTAEINVKGTLRMTKAAVPLLQERGGSVVVIGTNGVYRPRIEVLRFAYAMSKGALLTGVRYLARELGRLRIRVNTVAPGFKWGPVVEAWAEGQAEARGISVREIVEGLERETSLGVLASDDDVADSVVFFLSDLSAKITGQLLVVDSGTYLG